MKISILLLSLISIISAAIIAFSTYRNLDQYPIWVYKSYFILAAFGFLWGVLAITSNSNVITLTQNQFLIVSTLRTASLGIMIGMGIVLVLAGHLKCFKA